MYIKYTEDLMQYALTRGGNLFDYGRYAVVPNVSWGLGLNHEADLLCLSRNDVFNEIEIKVSKSDLKKDKEKKWGHYSRFIRHLWFAVPETIDVDFALEHIPEYAGLVYVESYKGVRSSIRFKTRIIRKPRPRRRPGIFQKPETKTIIKFLRLGVLRMWTDTHRFNEYIDLKTEEDCNDC